MNDHIIERVEVFDFTYEARHVHAEQLASGAAGGFVYAKDKTARLRAFAVRITTQGGAMGAYVPYQGATANAFAEVLKLAPRLLGRDAFAREEINLALRILSRSGDGGGVGPLDIALWDLAGRAFGISVTRLLGGWKARLPAYVSTLRFNRSEGHDERIYGDFADMLAARGVRGMKLHPPMDNTVEQEVALLHHVARRAAGRLALMHDPACIYTTFQHGLAVGRACDDAGYLWLEDSFADLGRSIFANRRLRERIRTPIVQGERLRGLEQKADLIVGQATDAVRADPELDLGITGLMKAAHLAEAFGLDIEVANGAPAQRHCVAAIRNTTFYELCSLGPDAPGNPTPPVYLCGYGDQIEDIGADGCVPVPAGPGLGVIYDWAFIASAASAHHDFRLGQGASTPPYAQ